MEQIECQSTYATKALLEKGWIENVFHFLIGLYSPDSRRDQDLAPFPVYREVASASSSLSLSASL